jgi:hypothetical protein
VGYALGAYVILSLIGYHPDAIGWQLAEELARTQGDPRECLQIIHPLPHFLSPSGDEQRANCIHEYAKLTKNPSACELLMPSRYGLSCVGGAENSQLPCNTDVKPYSVYWRDGEVEQTVNVRECIKQDANRSELGNLCCQVAQVAFMKDQNDCASVKNNTAVHDRCLYALAWKLRDPTYCSYISNENAHKACEVQTKALAKDPSICTGCTPPVESAEELRE